ncbi:MAG: MarR family transcriptional regulator [Alphaproteobacteria bacterium]|nr:MarR family transcriptional regulator [Alphaproteobacteria bacterium]
MMDLTAQIRFVRRFNRFYTRHVGALGNGHLDSSYSLTEVRLLYELAHAEVLTATRLSATLGLNTGYLSRVLRKFRDAGLIDSRPSDGDARVQELRLTDKGWDVFAPLQQRSRDEVAAILQPLSETDRRRLTAAMATIEEVLGETPAGPGYLLRPHRPGDIGWVIHKHATLYSEEYGWNEQFEVMVARIGADFIETYDPKTDCCWIAERDGTPVGSVFVVAQDMETAKLRMLYVDAGARGLGVGKRLVDEAIRFARRAGYARMTLWTNDILVAARGIYQAAGFELVACEPHHSFGVDLVGETWTLEL